MKYTQEQIELAKKFLSPDAFLLIVLEAIQQGKPLSAVGFGDGERSVMMNSDVSYLKNQQYLNEYGLTGVDRNEIKKQLFKAAAEADWFCPLISGITMPPFDCIRIVSPREQYVERLFPYAWYYMQIERHEIMKLPLVVCCRNSNDVMLRLRAKYQTNQVEAIEFSSWQDYDRALEEIGKVDSNLILCAVGQSGKYMIVEAARKYNKVVLDIGSALINKWQA